MTKEELMALDATAAAEEMNKLVAEGKSKDEVLANWDLSHQDMQILQVFWVKDKFIARAWGGYTSTKRSGNEFKAAEGGGWRNDAHDYDGPSH